jgi:hypothetical protein
VTRRILSVRTDGYLLRWASSGAVDRRLDRAMKWLHTAALIIATLSTASRSPRLGLTRRVLVGAATARYQVEGG